MSVADRSQARRIIHRAAYLGLSTIALQSALPLFAQPNAISTTVATSYGNNSEHGAYANINGIKLYYETYGKGQPILLIHGNNGSIIDMTYQIDFFAERNQVIVVDSRGHGKSEMGSGRLTYEQMADDYDKLLHLLNVKSINLLGWSDGGIIGLLLAINHPDKVGKLAVMGVNVSPTGAYKWAQDWVASKSKLVNTAIDSGESSNNLFRYKQLLDLLGKQPNISPNDLHQISAPTLIMVGDRDIIRSEHTLEIFNNIKNAQLCIFPGATHGIPRQDPKTFNEVVLKFFTNSFKCPDSKDMFQ